MNLANEQLVVPEELPNVERALERRHGALHYRDV
jgi:hypothetical protein